MMKAFVHIGTEKTGTTSLQHFFANNRHLLGSQGFSYPKALGEVNHLALAAYAFQDVLNDQFLCKNLALKTQGDVQRFRQDLRSKLLEEVKSSNTDKIILSNEHCSSRLTSPDEITALRDLLESVVEEIELIIYLRRQDSFLLSSYSTFIKSGNIKSLTIPSGALLKNHYDYWEILEKWHSIFAKHKIVVRVFEKGQLIDNDLIKDFSRIIGLQVDSSFDIPDSYYNVSLDPDCIEFLRLLNIRFRQMGNVNVRRANLIKLLGEISSNERMGLDEDELSSFMQHLEPSNSKVARHYLNREDGILFYDFPKPNPSSYALTLEKAFDIFAALWVNSKPPR
ncbi:MAG: hypothetical protein MUF72_04190 [Elainella sp. Prado103]|nr:hypothetical protein [Elainella sp. Prado103]